MSYTRHCSATGGINDPTSIGQSQVEARRFDDLMGLFVEITVEDRAGRQQVFRNALVDSFMTWLCEDVWRAQILIIQMGHVNLQLDDGR